MHLSECNPYLRAAQIQPAVLEGTSPRMAYDHRIFLILGGKGLICIAGQDYPLRENMFICIPPETEYYFRGKMKVAVLNYDLTRAFQNRSMPLAPVARSAYDPALRFDLVTAEGYDAPAVFPVDQMVRDAVLQIVAAFASKSQYSDARTSAELKELLCALLERQTAPQDYSARLIEKILLYIRSNAAEIKDNETLGKAFGYHPVYIASLIKEKTGKPLHRIILEERIRLACRFLRSTDNSVEQIAFDTGFSSRNHFCTVFKSIMRTTPLAYRMGKKGDGQGYPAAK